jgi:spermidine synthase
MNLVGFLKKFTTGKLLFQTFSPINRKIQVLEDFYGQRLVVGGLTQSGGQVERIWKEALNKIPNTKHQTPNILILGLGAGTLAELISQKWPEAKMIGVEIDPEIIKVGKKYFALGKIPNLKIVNADAAWYLAKLEIRNWKFEIIFVDVYLADQVPFQCETMGFLRCLERKLAEDGLLVFNRLNYKKHKGKTRRFLDKLEKIFQTTGKKKVAGNLLVFAKKKDVKVD